MLAHDNSAAGNTYRKMLRKGLTIGSANDSGMFESRWTTSGEKETWSCQGEKDAYMGETLERKDRIN
jgi:hypothetical protein